MEKVVLVCLQSRTREVRFSPSDDADDLTVLEKAIRDVFSDLSVLQAYQLVIQVHYVVLHSDCACVCTL